MALTDSIYTGPNYQINLIVGGAQPVYATNWGRHNDYQSTVGAKGARNLARDILTGKGSPGAVPEFPEATLIGLFGPGGLLRLGTSAIIAIRKLAIKAGTRLAAMRGARLADDVAGLGDDAAKALAKQADDAPKDVALGLKTIDKTDSLKPFSIKHGASTSDDWEKLGLHNAPEGRFDIAFKQTLDKTIKNGGRIKFNLNGIDIKKSTCWQSNRPSWSLYRMGVTADCSQQRLV